MVGSYALTPVAHTNKQGLRVFYTHRSTSFMVTWPVSSTTAAVNASFSIRAAVIGL